MKLKEISPLPILANVDYRKIDYSLSRKSLRHDALEIGYSLSRKSCNNGTKSNFKVSVYVSVNVSLKNIQLHNFMNWHSFVHYWKLDVIYYNWNIL